MKIETPLFVTIMCASSWGILVVFSRIILLEYNIAPATFVFIQMLSGGVILTLISHKRIKTIGLMPLKQLHTWGFGFFRVLSASFYVGALVYVSATNVAFMGATTVIMSVILVWIFLKRKPKLIELPGHVIIIIVMYYFVMRLDGQFFNPAVWMLLISQVIISIAIIIGETHPLNHKNSKGDTLYLTGMVFIVSAFMLLSLSYVGSIFEAQLPDDFYPEIRGHITRFVLQDIFNPYAWAYGFLSGATLRAAAIYYSLRSVALTSSEFYLGSMSLMPFIIMVFEYPAMQLGYLPLTEFSPYLIMLGSISCAASVYIIFFKRSKNKVSPA